MMGRTYVVPALLLAAALVMTVNPVFADIDAQHRTDSFHWFNKAQDFFARGELQRAEKALEIALMLDPANFKATQLKEDLAAKKIEAIRPVPKPAEPEIPAVKEQLTGMTVSGTGKTAVTEEPRDPQDARGWFERGRGFYQDGNLEKAKKCLQIAIELDEKNFEIRRLLGTISARLKASQLPVKKIPVPGSVPLLAEPEKTFKDKRIIEEKLGSQGVKERVVIIRPGDTLSSLAARFMGDPLMFRKLAEYNDLEDPNRLNPGDVIRIPVLGEETAVLDSDVTVIEHVPSGPDFRKIFPPSVKKPVEGDLPKTVLRSISSIPALKQLKVKPETKEPIKITVVDQATAEVKQVEVAVVDANGLTMDDLNFLKKKPTTAKEYYRRSQILWKLNKLEDAMDSYKRAIQADPRFLARKDGDKLVEEALTHMADRVPRYRRTSAEMHYALASIYHRSGRYHDAVEEYRKALERDPEYHEAYFNLGLVYEKLGAIDLAVETYEKVNEIFNTSSSMVNLATERIMQLVEWKESSH